MSGTLKGVARMYYEHADMQVRPAHDDEMDGELDRRPALLDVCAAARDALGAMRESVIKVATVQDVVAVARLLL
jgi:hypothetical protein